MQSTGRGNGMYVNSAKSAIEELRELGDDTNTELSNRFERVLPYATPIFEAFASYGHSGFSAKYAINCIKHCLETGGEGLDTEDSDLWEEAHAAIEAYNATPQELREDLKTLVLAILNHHRLIPITLEDNWVEVDDGVYQNGIAGHIFYESFYGLVYFLDGFAFLEKIEVLDDQGNKSSHVSATSSSSSIRFINLPSKHSNQRLYAWDLPETISLVKGQHGVKNKFFPQIADISEQYRSGILSSDTFDWSEYEELISNLIEEEKTIEFLEEDVIKFSEDGTRETKQPDPAKDTTPMLADN